MTKPTPMIIKRTEVYKIKYFFTSLTKKFYARKLEIIKKNSIMIIIATESQKEKACIKRIIKRKSYLYLKIILNKVTQE